MKPLDNISQLDELDHIQKRESDVTCEHFFAWQRSYREWQDVVDQMNKALAIRASYFERVRELQQQYAIEDDPLPSASPSSSVN